MRHRQLGGIGWFCGVRGIIGVTAGSIVETDHRGHVNRVQGSRKWGTQVIGVSPTGDIGETELRGHGNRRQG